MAVTYNNLYLDIRQQLRKSGIRHVDAELYYQRAGRRHDRGGHPLAGTGIAQRKGQGRVVKAITEHSYGNHI